MKCLVNFLSTDFFFKCDEFLSTDSCIFSLQKVGTLFSADWRNYDEKARGLR